MTFGSVLLIVLVLLLIAAIPTWPYSREWGYMPSGILGVLLLVLVLLLLMGMIPFFSHPTTVVVPDQTVTTPITPVTPTDSTPTTPPIPQ